MMDDQLARLLDALHGVRLLPRRAFETNVVYGYVAPDELTAVTISLLDALVGEGYEVHQCAWPDETVLLALNNTPEPLAIRLTGSADERYNLYALSRPRSAQALWQWAQTMQRQHSRRKNNSLT
jgi:hypothetical protein